MTLTITELQTALQQLGFLAGEPSGKWDDAMHQALAHFQRRNGLVIDGAATPETRDKIAEAITALG